MSPSLRRREKTDRTGEIPGCNLSLLKTDVLSSQDRVLVELFKFAKEEHVVKIDEFLSYMHEKVDMKELYRSLNKLERLSCIERSETEINLIEEIVLR